MIEVEASAFRQFEASKTSFASDRDASGSTRCSSVCGSNLSYPDSNTTNANVCWSLPLAYYPLQEKYGIFLNSKGHPKKLGQGMYGVVYEGFREEDGLKVAIKAIPLNKQSQLQVDREVLALFRVADNPHVLKCLDVMYSENCNYCFIVTEFCNGGDLVDYMEQHVSCISEHEARRLLNQLIDAVEYIHRNGIVHRDLKAENIVVQDANTLKIIDFGLSVTCSVTDDTLQPVYFEDMCGTPDYMAPEIFKGSYHGPEADIWSLGVVLYTLLVGRTPFDAPSGSEKINLIKEAQYNNDDLRFTRLSDEVRSLFSSIFTVEPEKRWTLQQVRESSWMNRVEPKYEGEVNYDSVWATMPQRFDIQKPTNKSNSSRGGHEMLWLSQSIKLACCMRGISKLWQDCVHSS